MIDRQNSYLYKRTIVNILRPLKTKWALGSYSQVIERLTYEWLQLKEEKKRNPFPFVEADIAKILKGKL